MEIYMNGKRDVTILRNLLHPQFCKPLSPYRTIMCQTYVCSELYLCSDNKLFDISTLKRQRVLVIIVDTKLQENYVPGVSPATNLAIIKTSVLLEGSVDFPRTYNNLHRSLQNPYRLLVTN
jgi:hypothetical protein